MQPRDAEPAGERAERQGAERQPNEAARARTPRGLTGYDPGIPTREGFRAPAPGPAGHLGTGASGPHDIGTRPEDVPRDPLRAMNDPRAPQNRVWARDHASGGDDAAARDAPERR